MREFAYGAIPNLINSIDHDILFRIFQRMCLSGYFEVGFSILLCMVVLIII